MNEIGSCEVQIPDIKHFRTHVSSIRGRAKKNGIPFDLDAEYLQSIWTGICPVFGTTLKAPGYGSVHDALTCASLDKNIPSIGYTRGNVSWISYRANILKRDATTSELMEVVKWMQSLNLPDDI